MGAVQANDPTAAMIGQVMSVDPLKVWIDQKLTLESNQLILTRNVTNFTVEIGHSWATSFNLGEHTHTCPDGTTSPAKLTHNHDVVANEITLKQALQPGEKVLLIRQEGGQKFFIIDRVVT